MKTKEICSEEEIQGLESKLVYKLPSFYRKFLKNCPNRAYKNLVGTDIGLPYLEDMKEAAEELLEECGNPFSLETDDFVFAMHQGYQFYYFKTSLGKNSPIYYYMEGSNEVEESYLNFSEFVEAFENY